MFNFVNWFCRKQDESVICILEDLTVMYTVFQVVEKNNKHKWAQNWALGYPRCYTVDFRERAVNLDLLWTVEQVVCEPVKLVPKHPISNKLFKKETVSNCVKWFWQVDESLLFGTAQLLSRHGRNLNINYENTPINFVTEYVYLGNLLDNQMSLSKNFDRAYRKSCGRLRLHHTRNWFVFITFLI